MRISKKHVSASIAALFVTVVAVQSFGIVQAEPKGYVQADCPNIVKQAIDTVSAQCGKTARGKLCYGNSNITAQFQPGANNIQFNAPGDTVDVSAIKQFTLGGMDTAANSWGVAEMKIKADLPDADPSQAVTMILFGDVQLSDASGDANAAVPGQTATVAARTATVAPARQTQSVAATNAAINQQATKSAATATKIAGLEATATAHALTPTPTGTIPAVKATQAAATATKLAAIEATATAAPYGISSTKGPYSGLQAFYFQSSDTAPCDQAPHDGILIQSPQGNKQRVTLVIDGATISLGSTVYITAQPNRFLTINTLEGSALVTVADQSQVARAGFFVQVPLDANLHPSGPPVAQVYMADAIRALPIKSLPSEIIQEPGLRPGTVTTVWSVSGPVGTVKGTLQCVPTHAFSVTVRLIIDADNGRLLVLDNQRIFVKSADGTYSASSSFSGIGNISSGTGLETLQFVDPTHITAQNVVTEQFTAGGSCTWTQPEAYVEISAAGGTPAPSSSATP